MNLSIHPARATPERLPPCGKTMSSSRLPVDSISPRVTCPLRSAGVTPLPRYYEAVRPWSTRWYFRPHGLPLVPFPLPFANQVLSSARKPQTKSRPLYTAHRTASKSVASVRLRPWQAVPVLMSSEWCFHSGPLTRIKYKEMSLSDFANLWTTSLTRYIPPANSGASCWWAPGIRWSDMVRSPVSRQFSARRFGTAISPL